MAGRYGRWRCITDAPPWAPRDGAGAVVFRGKMWLLGGWNHTDPSTFPDENGQTCSEVWSSMDGASWKLELAEAPWPSRHCSGFLVHDDAIWLVGGDNGRGPYQKDVWRSTDGVNWELVLAEGPWPDRALYLTAVFDGRLWIMGGQGNAPNLKDWEAAGGAKLTDGRNGASEADVATDLRDVWASANGVEWELVTDSAPWAPRGMMTGSNGGVAVHDGKMFILGGGYVGPGGTAAHTRKYSLSDQPRMAARKFLNDVWSSTNGRDWELVCAEAPWCGRSNADVAVWNDEIWVLAGTNGIAGADGKLPEEEDVLTEGNRNDCWHSPDGVNWVEHPGTPWKPRHASSLFVFDDALWIAAGNVLEWTEEELGQLTERGWDWPGFPKGVWAAGDVWQLRRESSSRL
jgi:hypothetical protein